MDVHPPLTDVLPAPEPEPRADTDDPESVGRVVVEVAGMLGRDAIRAAPEVVGSMARGTAVDALGFVVMVGWTFAIIGILSGAVLVAVVANNVLWAVVGLVGLNPDSAPSEVSMLISIVALVPGVVVAIVLVRRLARIMHRVHDHLPDS